METVSDVRLLRSWEMKKLNPGNLGECSCLIMGLEDFL